MNHILKWTVNINMNFTRTKRGDKSAYCWQYRVGRMTVSDERLYQCGGWFRPLKICRITKNEMALIAISIHYKQIFNTSWYHFFASELELIKTRNVTLDYVLVLAIKEFHIKTPPFLHQAYLCICKSNGRNNVPQAKEPVCLSIFGWLAYKMFTGTMCPEANEDTVHMSQFGTHCATKYWVNPPLECIRTLRLDLFRTLSLKSKFVETKISHADKQVFIKILWRRFWDTWFAKLEGQERQRLTISHLVSLSSTHQNQTLELKKHSKFLFLLHKQWRQELKL